MCLAEKETSRAVVEIDRLDDGRIRAADWTASVRWRKGNFVKSGLERVVGKEASREEFANADDVLDRLHGLECSDYATNASDHACRVARWRRMLGRIREDTPETGRMVRYVGRGLSPEL